MKLFDTFAGIGATHKALSTIGIDVELVGYSENNKYADICYRHIHNVDESLNYGDIEKIDPSNLPSFDIMNFSFPCKDFSVAGKMKGLSDDKGITHSGLYHHGMRIIKGAKPKYVLVENVKGITFKKFEKDFALIRKEFNDNGYNTYWTILNASDFEHPQNRERMIMICVRKDIDVGFEFPKPRNKHVSLRDIIVDEVDEKYYQPNVSIQERSKKTSGLMIHTASVKVRVRKYDVDIKALQVLLRTSKKNVSLSNRQLAELTGKPMTMVEHWFRTDGSFSIPTEDIWYKLKGILNIDDDSFDKSIMTFEIREGVFEKSKRVYDIDGIAPTLTATSPNEKILLQNNKIRELIPLECWLLMGFSREDFEKARQGILKEDKSVSNVRLEAELYERAGRSIPINILTDVFKQLFKG